MYWRGLHAELLLICTEQAESAASSIFVVWVALVVGLKPHGGAARAAAIVTDEVLCYVCCDVGCIELRQGVFWGLFPVWSP